LIGDLLCDKQQSYEPSRGRRPAAFRPTLNWFSVDTCLDTALTDDDDEVMPSLCDVL